MKIKRFESAFNPGRRPSREGLVNLKKPLGKFLDDLKIKHVIEHTKETNDDYAELKITFVDSKNLDCRTRPLRFFNAVVIEIIDGNNHITCYLNDESDDSYVCARAPKISALFLYIKEIIENTDYNNLNKCKFDVEEFELQQNVKKYNL